MSAKSIHGAQDSIRAFIAIELPSSIREDLYHLGKEATSDLPPRVIHWVQPSNIHLTLRFLGDTPLDLVTPIGEALQANLIRIKPFTLKLDNLGCFPNPGKPRVIWVGLAGDIEELKALNYLVEQNVKEFGWEPEKRRFHPHLTLGRVKDSRTVANAKLPYGESLIDRSFRVSSLSLIESKLTSGGAIYQPRITCMFGES